MHDHTPDSNRSSAPGIDAARLSRRHALGLGGLGAAAAAGLTGLTTSSASAAGTPDRKVLFRDDFNGPWGTSPDRSKWTFALGNGEGGWGNNELENYTDSWRNAMVNSEGVLVITARHEDGQWTSARMTTENSFTFRHGVAEARMLLPSTTGSWPAFWAMPKNAPTWPAGGEIDIMEKRGWQSGTISGALHGTGYSGGDARVGEFSLPTGQEFTKGWHRFSVRKEPGRITWYVDGKQFHQVSKADVPSWPYEDYDYYLILNHAIGGPLGGDPAGSQWPQETLVDYVYVAEL